jgi:HD-like signal output (HDOD) protein
VAVGTVARDLLALNGQSDASESAYLAGLLHDVGKPVVATLLLEAERQTTELYNRSWIESGEWVEVVARTHRTVGRALSEKWQLPDAVSACIRDCSEYDNSDRASLVNVVCFANAIAKKSGVYAGAVDQGDVDAVIMIGRSLIGVNDELLRSLTKQIAERVAGLYH